MTSRSRDNSLPVFIAGLVMLGYGVGHQFAYAALGIADDDSARAVHHYLPKLGLVAAFLVVIAFGLLARALFAGADAVVARPNWRARIAVAVAVPAAAFLAGESVELLLAPAAYVDPVALFAVGVPVQVLVGLFAIAVARLAWKGAAAAVRLLRGWRGQVVRAPRATLRAVDAPLTPVAPIARRLAGRAPPALVV